MSKQYEQIVLQEDILIADKHLNRCSLVIKEAQMSNEIYIILARMTVFKMTYNNKCWLRCGELEHSYHADRDIKWATSLEASVMVPHKGKHEPPTGPSNSHSPGLRSRSKAYVHTKRRESVFTEVLFIIAPN